MQAGAELLIELWGPWPPPNFSIIKKLPLNLVKIFKNIWIPPPKKKNSHNSHVVLLNWINFMFVITLAPSLLKF